MDFNQYKKDNHADFDEDSDLIQKMLVIKSFLSTQKSKTYLTQLENHVESEAEFTNKDIHTALVHLEHLQIISKLKSTLDNTLYTYEITDSDKHLGSIESSSQKLMPLEDDKSPNKNSICKVIGKIVGILGFVATVLTIWQFFFKDYHPKAYKNFMLKLKISLINISYSNDDEYNMTTTPDNPRPDNPPPDAQPTKISRIKIYSTTNISLIDSLTSSDMAYEKSFSKKAYNIMLIASVPLDSSPINDSLDSPRFSFPGGHIILTVNGNTCKEYLTGIIKKVGEYQLGEEKQYVNNEVQTQIDNFVKLNTKQLIIDIKECVKQ